MCRPDGRHVLNNQGTDDYVLTKYVAIVIIDVYDVVIFIIFCMNDIHIAKSFLLSVSVVEAS